MTKKVQQKYVTEQENVIFTLSTVLPLLSYVFCNYLLSFIIGYHNIFSQPCLYSTIEVDSIKKHNFPWTNSEWSHLEN